MASRRYGQPPLWIPQLPINDNHIELGFRDLIELRFVAAFLDQGLKLPIIRSCLETARELVGDAHPFSTRRFKTDGQRIYLETLERIDRDDPRLCIALPPDAVNDSQQLDLRSRQYVFAQLIARSFKDLDIDANSVVRWRPYKGRDTVVIDPQRAFGQPITPAGVPTAAIAGAVEAEGSQKRVAFLFDIPLAVVRDAVKYEADLAAA